MRKAEIDSEKVWALYEEGYTMREIAEKFGVSAFPIRRILLESGVKIRQGGNKEKPKEEHSKFRRIRFLRGLKLDKKCSDCGWLCTLENYEAFQWDHLPGWNKKFEISQSWAKSRTEEDIYAEVAKCELRCANCHAIMTMKRRNL